MKCVYYSYYPYESDDFKVVDAESHGCDWTGSAFDMPFRLYKAAVCDGEFSSAEDFVSACFEALDMPHYKGVIDFHKLFKLYDVHVSPTKHLYGATNSMDGVYLVNDIFYAVNNRGEVIKYNTWHEAVDAVRLHLHGGYIQGVDYSMEA